MGTSQTLGSTSCLSDKALKALKALARSDSVIKLQKALGKEADLYLVGGTVRDTLEFKPSGDLDLATALPPNIVIEKLEAAKIHCVPTGVEHGTVTAVINKANIELTTFRIAGQSREMPDAPQYAKTIEQDLAGRDFTINAMAFGVNQHEFIDPFSGANDLEKKKLLAVGDPKERFSEDPLRIMRMIRFGPAGGFEIDQNTAAQSKLAIRSLENVSIERIQTELVKILCSAYAGDAFRKMRDLGILEIVLPEIVPCYDFEQNEYHRFDVFEHTLAVIDNCPIDQDLRLTALFHDIGKPATLSIGSDGRRHFYRHEIESTEICKAAMKRLRFSKKQTELVCKLVRYHMRPLECGPVGVRRLIRDLDHDIEAWTTFKRADALGAKIEVEEFENRLAQFVEKVETEKNRTVGSPYDSLAVNGHDLIELGFKTGPNIGLALKELMETVIENPALNTKPALLARAKQILNNN